MLWWRAPYELVGLELQILNRFQALSWFRDSHF